MFNFLALIQVALAVFLIVGAITGKNKVFIHRFIKKGKEALYKKWMRILFGVSGGLMAALGIVNIIGSLKPPEDPLFQVMANVGLVLGIVILTILIGMYFFYLALSDKTKKTAPVRSTAPRAAFYFDEETNENEKSGKKKS